VKGAPAPFHLEPSNLKKPVKPVIVSVLFFDIGSLTAVFPSEGQFPYILSGKGKRGVRPGIERDSYLE
jgi:hypothetical protein